jgi:GlpG protein
MDEDKIESANDLLKLFKQNPEGPKFRTEGKAAAKLRAREEKDQEEWRKKLQDRRHLFRPLREYSFGALTFVLMAISVGVFLLMESSTDHERVAALFISERMGHSLPEVRQGELWRLFTPIFLHMGWLHILFNMLWLRDLGSMVEGRQNSVVLGLLVLVFAAGSNLAQYFLEGPAFGGMSGVVYGLLGYIWIRGKLDPGSGLYLNQPTVIMMLLWMVVGFSGAMHMANWAHLGGLVLGMGWGYFSSLRYR